ncbi:hypothetical protein ES703_10156 [subsurface metagenome]
MGKYLILWEADNTRMPVDPKERDAVFKPIMAMVKQDIQRGIVKDRGMFIGESNGYTVAEGTEEEIDNMTERWVPFFTSKVHAIASFSQVEEILKG